MFGSRAPGQQTALLVVLGVLYVAICIGIRTLGYADITDTHGQLTVAGPDLLDGEFTIYSRGAGHERLAPGMGIRMGYPPGPILLHVPFVLFIRAGLLPLDTAIVWAALPGAIGEVLCVWALLQIWGRAGQDVTSALPLLGALAFIRAAVVWHDAALHGHWEGLMAFCALQAYRHVDGRPGLAGAWAGGALLLKTPSALAVGPIALGLCLDAMRARAWRPLVQFVVPALLVLGLPLIPYLMHDPAGVRDALMRFPTLLAIAPGSTWWLALRAFGLSSEHAAFLALRLHANQVLLGTALLVSGIVLWRTPRSQRAHPLLGLMAFGTIGLVALGKSPNEWYAVMGTACLLAWCGARNTQAAWGCGLGYVLVQDAAVAMLPGELARGAMSCWGFIAFASIGAVLLLTSAEEVPTAPVRKPAVAPTG